MPKLGGVAHAVTYQIQDGHLHHALVEIGRAVLDDLDGDNLLGLQILALDDLTECALAEHVKNKVAVPGCGTLAMLST